MNEENLERVWRLCKALDNACKIKGEHRYEIIKAIANELIETLDLTEGNHQACN